MHHYMFVVEVVEVEHHLESEHLKGLAQEGRGWSPNPASLLVYLIKDLGVVEGLLQLLQQVGDLQEHSMVDLVVLAANPAAVRL